LQSQISELERQIVEGEIKRSKTQREVARLKCKILAKHNADRGDAAGDFAKNSGSSSVVEGIGRSDDGEDEPHCRSRQQRKKPSGLSYKLRATASRATMYMYIGRKADQLKKLLTHVVGNYDNWQRVFGDGEEEADNHVGDSEHRRGEQSREAPGDMAGQPSDVRASHTPRFILAALLAN
jgi:hypothetical protein